MCASKAPRFEQAYLHSVHDGKSKIVRAQIDSASTCNTNPSNLLSQLFDNLNVSKIRSRISSYESQTMRPKGQVTLVCDRKGRLQTKGFLVVEVPGDKPPLLKRKEYAGSGVFEDLCRRNKRS